MDPARFYGKKKYVNTIPGDGFLSEDDELDSDTDVPSIPIPVRRPLVIPETDDDSTDEEENIPLAKLVKDKKVTKKTRKVPAVKTEWKSKHLDPYNSDNFTFAGDIELPSCIIKLDTPVEFFKFLFTNDLMSMIVKQSNLKSVQDNVNKPACITNEELEQFIGVVIFMSTVKLPAARMYWNNNIGQSQVYETMTCNRWETIKRFLHFSDNTKFIKFGQPGYDKLFKIRPLLEHIRQRLLLVPKEEYLAVDEQMIPTKGRHELKQYNPAKPDKWGYKNQVLSGASGFSYDFDLFAGDQSNKIPEGAPDLGVSGNVVARLTETVPKHKNHKIFFDNWYNSPKLQVYLSKIGLLPLGTVRMNRVPNAEMPTEKELKQQGRGFMVEKTAEIDDVQLALTSWFDNKPVNMLSTYVGTKPTTKKRRYFRKERQYKEIDCPQAVEIYNRHMGGVDLLDSMLGLYRIHLRSKKWYKRIFFHMIDLCVVNAWILWRRKNTNDYLSLFAFKLAISEHLCKVGKFLPRKRGRPSLTESPSSSRQGSPLLSNPGTPVSSKKMRKNPERHQDIPLNSVRTDNIGHWPSWQKKRQHCVVCSMKTYTKCTKCKVFLCYNDKRNCLVTFHDL